MPKPNARERSSRPTVDRAYRSKTNAQTRRMFGLAKTKAAPGGYEPKDYIESVIHAVTLGRKDRISDLDFNEANDVIKVLGGDPLPAYGTSKRTENYRKQKAGIKTIETEAHLHKIHDLAAARNMSDEGLQSLASRMSIPWPPQTTDQGNKIVEALKAMNKRDNVREFPNNNRTTAGGPARTGGKAAKEPSFRRVA